VSFLCQSFNTGLWAVWGGCNDIFGQGYAPVGYFLWHFPYKSRLKVKWYQGSRNSVLEKPACLRVKWVSCEIPWYTSTYFSFKFPISKTITKEPEWLKTRSLFLWWLWNSELWTSLQRAVFLILLKSLAGDQCPRVYRGFKNHNFHFH